MSQRTGYKTKQREAVLSHIVSLGNTHVTASQIIEHFQNEGISIGRTTIFRLLDKLVQEGHLKKYTINGITGACYQYIDIIGDPEQHLLLKCEDCGELFYTSCGVLNDIYRHIFGEHTFKVNTMKTVFYGRCASCSKDIL